MAVLYAPFAQRVFQITLLDPISYYWWRAQQVIHVIPEIYYWFFFIACFGVLALFFLLQEAFRHQVKKVDQVVQKGPMEFLSEYIVRSAKSNYFKWVIANRLANIALHILWYKDGKGEKPRNFSFTDRAISPAIKTYLETGLFSSFMDFRQKSKLFGKSQEIPLNVDIHQVLDWVESQMEQ